MSAVEDKVSTLHSSNNTSNSLDLPAPFVLTPKEEARAWRKIDIRLMPILTLLYLCSSLDRGNISLARLQGLPEQLNLTGDEYNFALTVFLIPYCLFEFPSNLVLKRLRPSRWLPGITFTWGVITMSMGFVKTYQQLVVARFFLGLAEAGLFPGVIYYLTLWYPRHKLQYRIGLFYGAASLAGAFSGILAYGISFMSGAASKLGWSWIFILEGCGTCVIAILAFLVMVDFPPDAKFLTSEERRYVMWRKKYGATSIEEEEHFEFRHIILAIVDWQLWLHVLLVWSVLCPVYGISLFLPSIIRGFGYSVPITNLLTVPPFAVATIFVLLFAHFSDKLRLRWPFILAGLLTSAVGFGVNISNAPAGVKYFGTFLCVTGSFSAIPGVVAWLGGNITGQYKRAVALALFVGIGNAIGVVASNIYRTKDSPRYKLGHESQWS